jgi:hypothetical protein
VKAKELYGIGESTIVLKCRRNRSSEGERAKVKANELKRRQTNQVKAKELKKKRPKN